MFLNLPNFALKLHSFVLKGCPLTGLSGLSSGHTLALPERIIPSSKAYDYAVEHNVFHEFRRRYKEPLRKWERLRKMYKMSFEDLAKEYRFLVDFRGQHIIKT